MKKVFSLIMAFVIAVTIIGIPIGDIAYADVSQHENTGIIDIASEEISAELNSYQYDYTGKKIEPKPIVSFSGTILEADKDYMLIYSNNINAGKATVRIEGKGDFEGEREIIYDIMPADISTAEVDFGYFSYNYYGSTRTPDPTVTFDGIRLNKGTDYTVNYENNVYPGTATTVIKGIGNYGAEVRADFYIARIKALTVKTRSNSYLKVSWKKNPNVSGYELCKYNSSNDTWEKIAKIESNNTTEYKIDNLSASREYQFKIRTFFEDSEKNIHYGEWSNVLTTITKPSQGKVTELTTDVKMRLNITWAKRTCDGYQIYASKDKSFKNPMKATVNSSSTLTKAMQAKKDNTYYYVKVRPYKIYDGKKIYGSWSSVKKIKTDGTGWLKDNNRKYYYKDGELLKGTQKINGNQYYFGKNTGVLLGSSAKMYNKTKKATSDTKYLIAVSRAQNRVCVYQKSKKEWVVKYYWKCSTGEPRYSSISCTPSGSFEVPDKRTHQKYFGDKSGYRCWYTTRIHKSYLFHSILYQPYSSTRIQDGRLGYNISHGCIRLKKDNAYWLYKNIDAGTRVIIL